MRSFTFKPSSWKINIDFFPDPSFSKEYSHAPKMLSHISNRPRVAYLVLVTLISHGKWCGTDFSDSELT